MLELFWIRFVDTTLAMRMASPQIGKICEFVPPKEDWTQYIECLDHFFVANDVDAADKKCAVLLTVISPTAY